MSAFGQTTLTAVAATFIAALLLLWPALYQPLPRFIGRADSLVVGVWTTYALSFGSLGILGATLNSLWIAIWGTPFVEWASNQLLEAAGVLLLSGFLSGFFGKLTDQLTSRTQDVAGNAP